MSTPKVVQARRMIHARFCPAAGGCRYAGGLPSIAGERVCTALDELLDFNDEQLLHTVACGLRLAMTRGPSAVNPGLHAAAEKTDPYVEIRAATEYDEVPPGTELYPDCPSCVAGKKHYHRKSDGSPVRASQLGEESRNE